jgi:hypothetical protein
MTIKNLDTIAQDAEEVGTALGHMLRKKDFVDMLKEADNAQVRGAILQGVVETMVAGYKRQP